MCHVLCAGTELKHWQNLGEGIDGQPEPQNLLGAAEPGAQLVQLEVWEMEMAEEALVQRLSMLKSASQHVVMVACRKPKTRSAAEASSPSASAESTMATLREGFSDGTRACCAGL